MRIWWSWSALCVLAGVVLLRRAATIPVYTDPDAPGRLSVELQRERRFDEWGCRLAGYETAHKKIYDWEQGLAALGVGGLLVVALLLARRRFSGARGKLPLTAAWLLAWAAQVPCVCWFYYVGYQRFDYPTWGDSIAIPIFNSMLLTVLGALVTTPLLLALMLGRTDTGRLSFVRPASGLEWARTVFLVLWMALLVTMAAASVPGGDLTYILPGVLALPVLAVAAFGMERTVSREPAAAVAGGFARWFRFTLIHPALSAAALALGAGLSGGDFWGMLGVFFSISAFTLNLPGVLLVRQLPGIPDIRLLSTPAPGLWPAMLVTWALLVAAAWLVFRWQTRAR
jgi:hypothetical protein